MLRIRHIFFVFLFTIALTVVNTSYGQEKINLDSLKKATLAPNLTHQEQYKRLDKLIEEAKKQQNNKTLSWAYMSKVVLAYNTYDLKEVEKWVQIMGPLVIQEKQFEYFFRGKQCLIDLMLLKGELEKGEEEAKKMLADAKVQEHKVGIVLAHLCLSHAYSMSYREKLAAQELEEAFLISAPIPRNWRITKEIIHALITSYEKLADYPNQLKYLKKQAELLRKRIKEHPKEEEGLKPDLNLAYILFVNHYLNTDNPKMAKQYLDSSTKYMSLNYAGIYHAFYYDGCFKYYEYIKDYKNALWSIDSLSKYGTTDVGSDKIQSLRARILWKSGALKEAVDLYEATMYLRDSLSTELLNKQILQIQQTDENNQMQLEQEKIQNYINLSLLLAALVGLAMLVSYIVHTVKIKNSLQKAEQEARQMSEQMKGANLAKDKFLSNISQTISTPLNIIVESSTELAANKEISPEKKDELSALVLQTTEALMALINNILDLSRLEAGMMKFSAEDISPLSFIRLFLSTVSDRKVTVSLKMEEQELEKSHILFDSGKLSQLLDKTFTPNKELTLSVDRKNNVVELTVIGSGLASVHLTQDIIIQNEINRLLIQHFNGEYLVQPEKSTITITIPVTSQSVL